MNTKTVVVTGAAGYIGGQISLQLKDAGHRVVGIDNRNYPGHLAGVFDSYLHNDFASNPGLNVLIREQPAAIVHCAGTSLVGPSIKNPDVYFENNVVKTLKMLDIVCQAIPRTRVIFSSSAAVYGTPIMNPCHEVDPREPISPYGHSKLMVETIMESYRVAYGLDYVAFRYFNACGADSLGRHGQEAGATHIIARVLESMRDGQPFTLNGTDFATADGTCVRDYVHVEDIARAHVMALDSKIDAGVYNLSTGQGTSNAEIVDAAKAITNRPLNVVIGPRRAGDPDELTAVADKFKRVAGDWQRWQLNDMIRHAWEWYVR
jgi:UDP-glucose 4-epimerase